MNYSWTYSIQDHLQDFSVMRPKEYMDFINHHRFNIPISLIFDHADMYGVESIEFNDLMLKELFEHMGDYDDLQPYCVNSIEKLNDDERDYLTGTLNLIKEEIVHVNTVRYVT